MLLLVNIITGSGNGACATSDNACATFISNMELLKSGFKSVLGAPQPGVQPTGAETVERLVDRVQSSTLLEDRRDAVRALKALSRKFRLEVGTQAMDPVISVLEVDRNDSEIVSYALETLCNIMSQDSLEHGDGTVPLDDTNELGKQFTEIFIKKSENVSLLLGLLEEYDSHVRWPAVQLLTCLLNNKLRDLQDIILVSPMGVSKLMDLLLDSREFIRNDALLLLFHLTKNNANIQKIVAFENAFDRLLIIINEEGNSDGGIVVEDCLQLLLNLLKNNSSNQTFFKEGSFIQHLMPFFISLNEGLNDEWSAQKVSNINLMLQVVRTLVSPSNPLQVTSACQKVMNSCGLLEQLCNILMAAGVPADTLTETLNTVSEVIRGNHSNQEYFASISAPSIPPRPAIVVLMMSMVNEKQPFILRCAVLYCFQSFLYKNELGQAQIVQTLLPTSADVSAYTAGQLLCGGLFSPDSLSTWCAAIALSHALIDNTPQKEQLLRVQLATNIGNPPVSLLQQCTSILQQGGKVQTRLGLLMLLSIWLSNCPLAVSHFVSIPTNVPFLTSQVALAEGDDLEFLVQGICAFLLGICVNFNDDSVPSFSKDSLCQLIAKRIGLETYLDKLGQISKHDMYSQALQKPQPKYKNPSEVFFDHEFCRLFKALEGQIIKAVTPRPKESLLNGPEANLSEAEHSLLIQYKNLIREQDQQLNELRQQLEDLQVEQSKSATQVDEMTSTIQQLKDQNALLKAHKGGLQTSSDGGNESLQLKQEIEKLKKQLEEKNVEMQEKIKLIEDLKSQISTMEKRQLTTPEGNDSSPEIDIMKSQILELELKIKELEKEKEVLHVSAQLKASAETETVALQAKINHLVEELENVRKEQEDLLVLLTEQDTKISTYTSRLKELGEKIDDDDDIDCEDRDLEDEEKD